MRRACPPSGRLQSPDLIRKDSGVAIRTLISQPAIGAATGTRLIGWSCKENARKKLLIARDRTSLACVSGRVINVRRGDAMFRESGEAAAAMARQEANGDALTHRRSAAPPRSTHAPARSHHAATFAKYAMPASAARQPRPSCSVTIVAASGGRAAHRHLAIRPQPRPAGDGDEPQGIRAPGCSRSSTTLPRRLCISPTRRSTLPPGRTQRGRDQIVLLRSAIARLIAEGGRTTRCVVTFDSSPIS